MRTLFVVFLASFAAFLVSCGADKVQQKAELTPEQIIQKNIDSLEAAAQPGDMIARMNDNIISYHVRNFNLKDKSFSHAGIVVMRNGQKVVCNIDANLPGEDTVRYDAIDSFISPKQNFLCGLFRFKISEEEKQKFYKELNWFHEQHAHFDKRYDLSTDSLVYCSEMISKSLNRATDGRLTFQETNTPALMVPLMTKYFQKEAPKNTPPIKIQKIIEGRKYIPIDALYLNDNCTELMRFKLKHFPGE